MDFNMEKPSPNTGEKCKCRCHLNHELWCEKHSSIESCCNCQPSKSNDLTNAKSAINKSASKSGKLINKQEKADLTVESSEGWEKAVVRVIANMVFGFNGSDKTNPPMVGLDMAVETFKETLSQQQKEVGERVRKETIDKAFDWIWEGWNLDLANKDRAKVQFLTSIEEKGGRG